MKNNKILDFLNKKQFREHRYLMMIGLTVVISLLITAFSLSLYHSSGAALLDLSRPGYQSIRSQTNGKEVESYPATGPLDREALDKFQIMFEERSKRIQSEDFSRDVLSDEALGIGAQSFETSEPQPAN